MAKPSRIRKKIRLVVILLPCFAGGQATYKGLPLIRANAVTADYRIGNDRVNGNWTISPWIESDSPVLTCFKGAERFVFYTNPDSIAFDIGPDEARGFYVSLSDTAYAFTLIKGVKPGFESLKFDHLSKDNALEFWYESNIDNVSISI